MAMILRWFHAIKRWRQTNNPPSGPAMGRRFE